VLGAPVGIPFGVYSPSYVVNLPQPNAPEIPGANLKRAVTYLADYGGCGFYRCMSPNFLLNLHQKAVIIESTTMVFDERFYQPVSAIKFQRQATPQQLNFVKYLKKICANKIPSTKFLYEVDDVVFAEDIPLYNKNRTAFTPDVVQSTIKEFLLSVDEILVTSEYFRDYMKEKSGNPNVSCIPNYLMKWWFDRYYNINTLIKNYEKNKKKPIIAIFASGTHVDVANRNNGQDDFIHVVDSIIKTRTEFEWHFYGAHPFKLNPYISQGSIKFFPWVQLPDFPQSMANSNAQLTFAALQDNTFNRCKSNIKLIEAGALGIPCVCPDLVTYKDAELKYKTGDEFIDCIKTALKNQTVYANYCKKAREYASNFWLDDEKNMMKHYEAFFTPYGSRERKYLR
jgi:hypothetical protein